MININTSSTYRNPSTHQRFELAKELKNSVDDVKHDVAELKAQVNKWTTDIDEINKKFVELNENMCNYVKYSEMDDEIEDLKCLVEEYIAKGTPRVTSEKNSQDLTAIKQRVSDFEKKLDQLEEMSKPSAPTQVAREVPTMSEKPKIFLKTRAPKA
jgi:uncharacterized coiled-coil DUF342 family protein